MKKKLIIFGDGPSAEVVAKITEEFKIFEIFCFTVNKKFLKKKKLLNYNIIEYEKLIKIKNKKDYLIFVSLGYSNLNKTREEILKNVKKDGFELTSIIHPNANICRSVKFGYNNFIMQDVHIHPLVKIGNNNFIWSGSIISHHVKIGNHCWFTSGSSIAGKTIIGNNCFFGINSTIVNNIKIGDEVFIGAGALVNKDLRKQSTILRKSDPLYNLKSDEFIKLIKNNF
jgi:sugar O-acyltransferase (sialic acid O-acetyltransferase NeuD family)